MSEHIKGHFKQLESCAREVFDVVHLILVTGNQVRDNKCNSSRKVLNPAY